MAAATVSRSGIGYGAGAGAAVTQATSKSTGVTLTTAAAAITLNAANLASNTKVSFTVTNALIAAADVPLACLVELAMCDGVDLADPELVDFTLALGGLSVQGGGAVAEQFAGVGLVS